MSPELGNLGNLYSRSYCSGVKQDGGSGFQDEGL